MTTTTAATNTKPSIFSRAQIIAAYNDSDGTVSDWFRYQRRMTVYNVMFLLGSIAIGVALVPVVYLGQMITAQRVFPGRLRRHWRRCCSVVGLRPVRVFPLCPPSGSLVCLLVAFASLVSALLVAQMTTFAFTGSSFSLL